jgi:hypothetical protein
MKITKSTLEVCKRMFERKTDYDVLNGDENYWNIINRFGNDDDDDDNVRKIEVFNQPVETIIKKVNNF